MAHPIEELIALADSAIVREHLDALLEIYADDAVLVVKPGLQVTGKAAIRKAFEAIAAHFEHSMQVRQAGLVVLESGDTALVLARTGRVGVEPRRGHAPRHVRLPEGRRMDVSPPPGRVGRRTRACPRSS